MAVFWRRLRGGGSRARHDRQDHDGQDGRRVQALMSRADPQAPWHERANWMIDVAEWVRHQPKVSLRDEQAWLGIKHARLAFLLTWLDGNREVRRTVQINLQRTLREASGPDLFSATGLPYEAAFFSELSERIATSLLPRHLSPSDLPTLFTAMFPKSSDAQWMLELNQDILTRLWKLAADDGISHLYRQQIDEALMSGVTTMIGGGTGPATGTNATTCTPGPWHLEQMLKAADGFAMNLGFTGKGNASLPGPLREQVVAGAVGLKLHEDWGTTPAAIDNCLTVADEMDVQVAIHTDTLNESGFVEASLAAFRGRTIHTYHTEGAGGGHAPDIIKACGERNVRPSSTNPTRPFTVNTIDEHLDMLMVCHHLDPGIAEDVAFAESRIRRETIAAEDILHDLGAFAMMSSDSQAMGRVGETILRCWQTADKMKRQRGPLPGDGASNDNARIKRYLAKYTINPAITHGISHEVGSIEVGKLADLIVWRPAFFGVKPSLILKGGTIAAAAMGDANASIPTPQPVHYRPMFGSYGGAISAGSVTFVSQAALAAGIGARLGLKKRLVAVQGCRSVQKTDLIHNDYLPRIEVDPQNYQVRADGQLLWCEPADVLPMAQRYFLF